MLRALALWFVHFLAAAAFAAAFDLEPISLFLEPTGPESTKSLRVTNTENHRIAVRIAVESRAMDEEGNETNRPAPASFVIFPSHLVLDPGAQQIVRVLWRGPVRLSSEQCYRMIAEQLPVNFGRSKTRRSSINILVRYRGSIYVTPPGARSNVELTDYRTGEGTGGAKGLYLTFENRGTAHAIIDRLTITVSGKSAGSSVTMTLPEQSLAGIQGQNILAGSVRRFFLPVVGLLPDQDLHVEAAFRPTQ